MVSVQTPAVEQQAPTTQGLGEQVEPVPYLEVPVGQAAPVVMVQTPAEVQQADEQGLVVQLVKPGSHLLDPVHAEATVTVQPKELEQQTPVAQMLPDGQVVPKPAKEPLAQAAPELSRVQVKGEVVRQHAPKG